MEASGSHAFLLATSKGDPEHQVLLGWGNARNGQLCLGKVGDLSFGHTSTPQLVRFETNRTSLRFLSLQMLLQVTFFKDNGLKVLDFALGEKHTVVLTEDVQGNRDVFVGGSNDEHQLGLAIPPQPPRMAWACQGYTCHYEHSQFVETKCLNCKANNHTIWTCERCGVHNKTENAICNRCAKPNPNATDAQVYTSRTAALNQQGIQTPCRLRLPKGRTPIKIAAGASFTVVVTKNTEDGDIRVLASGSAYDEDTVEQLRALKMTNVRVVGEKIVDVAALACGNAHICMLLTMETHPTSDFAQARQ